MSSVPIHPEVSDPSLEPSVRHAARALVEAVRRARLDAPLSSDAFQHCLVHLGDLRGRALTHPLLSGGVGEGARVRLADGRPVLDLVSGIGPYVFGHADADLLETAAIAAASDVAYQGHVLPGPEYYRLSQRLLAHAGGRLEHAWLALSGSMANENALKLILQRRSPADRLLVFERAFHGRTLAMAELTDRPEYREKLPTRMPIDRVPFFDPEEAESTDRSLDALDRAIAAHPGRHAAFCFELVQGEGGFRTAPAHFFGPLMARCREAGISVWIDEIQTFARSEGLFAFRTLGLDRFVDVVTAGKILHGSATLFAADHRPAPGLIAGTWAGSTVGMAIGARVLERLEQEGYLGSGGRIDRLAKRIDEAFERLGSALPGAIGGRTGFGAMQAFVAWDGDAERTHAIIEAVLEEGVLVQPAGGGPTKIRLLPPLNLTDEELAEGFAGLERGLLRVGPPRKGR